MFDKIALLRDRAKIAKRAGHPALSRRIMRLATMTDLQNAIICADGMLEAEGLRPCAHRPNIRIVDEEVKA